MDIENKRINRNDKFCSSVRKKDVSCVLSNKNAFQCECAHIVPLNGDYGQDNYDDPKLLNDAANGMLLSKELHFLYDQFSWCINPDNYEEIEGIPKKRKYAIEIASNYKDIELSINIYNSIILRAECHHFIEMAYKIFLDNWNPVESNYKKLTVKPNSKLYSSINVNLKNTLDGSKTYTTIDKMDTTLLEELTQDLQSLLVHNIEHNKKFNKKNKMELSLKYNLHHESIVPYYNTLKLELKKR